MDASAVPAQRITASLYVGDLPLDLPNPEDALYSLFNKVGMVMSIKVCRDINTQRSLGYAYVNFQAPADAERAIETLNYTEIIPNHQIRIMWSSRDPTQRRAGTNNLFIKNLDLTITARNLRDTFAVFGQIMSCKVATDENGKSRGYGFVQFEKDESAKRALSLNGTTLASQAILVQTFVKKAEREAEAAKTFTTVYVKNIKDSVTAETLKAEFAPIEIVSLYLSEISAEKPYKTKFALVTLNSHESALAVIEKFHNTAGNLAEEETKLYVARAQKKSERVRPVGNAQTLYQSQGRNVYVKHLDDAITKERLEELFAPFGKITSSALMKDAAGNFRGFGFVCFETKESAAAAIRELNGKQIFRRPLYVSQAQQRDMRHQVLDEQRKAILAQQQRFNMQMAGMYPRFNGMYPQMPPFMPFMPGMMNPSAMRRPPMGRVPMPGGPRLGGMNMPMRPMPNMNMNMFNQPPRSYTQPQQRMPQSTIMAQSLAKMTPEEQKNALGERLYAKIVEINPNQAAKITGMLLEMETGEILNVLEDQRTLQAKVSEAITVLQQHEAATH